MRTKLAKIISHEKLVYMIIKYATFKYNNSTHDILKKISIFSTISAPRIENILKIVIFVPSSIPLLSQTFPRVSPLSHSHFLTVNSVWSFFVFKCTREFHFLHLPSLWRGSQLFSFHFIFYLEIYMIELNKYNK